MPAGHQLAAIMFTDIVGYTALMGRDEATAMKLLEQNRKLHEPAIQNHQGKLLKEIGDGILASFNSVSNAIDSALQIMVASKQLDNLQLRIGIHLGEVMFKNDDVFGDGVNIAARIEAIASPGEILISEAVYRNIQNKKKYQVSFHSASNLKNVDHPVKIYQLGFVEKDLNQPVITPDSLAVLPFVNMSNDAEQEYFCEGISEEIINTVVQVPEIKVAGRTSSFSFKGQNLDLRLVGNQLGVSKILEGSVRKFGNRIRITAQLIEASSGFHLWSNKYDRELDDIFQIQDDISQEIAKHLQQTIIGEKSVPKPREHTQKIEAYELYLKGRSLYYRRGNSLWRALDCFKRALEIDPYYALASSGLADTYIMLSFHGYLHPEKCWAEALPAADKALRRGPDLGETHNTLAVIALLHDRDLTVAEKEFKKALDINPNHIQARCWYGLFYLVTATLQYEEGISELRKAIENDPLSSYAASCYALGLSVAGQIDDSIEWARKAVLLDAEAHISRYTLGFCYQWSGDITKCIEQYTIGLALSDRHGWLLGLLLQAYLQDGKPDQAKEIYQELDQRYEQQYLPPSILAQSAAVMGDTEKALKLAHEAADIIDPYLSNIITNYPEAKQLRALPGFEEIIKEFGYGG